MQKWEFRQIHVHWDSEQEKWTFGRIVSDNPLAQVASAMSDHYGPEGWELVGATVMDYQSVETGPVSRSGTPDQMVTTWRALRYIYYFKQPREE